MPRADILENLRAALADSDGNISDDSLTLFESVSSAIPTENGPDWEARYRQLDRDWKQKYTSAFIHGPEDSVSSPSPSASVTETEKEVSISDLLRKDE